MSDFTRYTADIDLRNTNGSHPFAIASVLGRSNVLDVGSADGSVARALQQMGCRVWGVEVDPEAAAQARQWCEDIVVGDLEELDLARALDRTFDVILFLDVLEHLRDPLPVLRQAIGLLDERGYVVISLPNVAHSAVRAQLLGGRFAYTDTGLLDRTHLRFFDSVSVRQFVADAGLVIIDESRVILPLNATEIPVDLGALDSEIVARLRQDPDAETYQFLFIAAPVGSELIQHPPLLPARILQRELRSMQERFGGEGQGGRVAKDDLMGELSALRGHSEARRRVLQDLLSEVDGNSKRLADELSP